MSAIGFVGLGNAGWSMAEHLLAAGFELLVYDRDEERTRRFVAEHDARAGTPPERFAGVDVVFTMLPHGGVVREVLLGDGGIAPHLTPGTIVVDTSSSDPIGTRALAAELRARGVAMMDSAVSEAKVGDAARGQITFMVGVDDDAAFDRVRPALEAMSTYILRVGPTGSGHAMKTLNNFISASGLYAALDSLIAGHLVGLDLQQLLDVFNVSTARNLSTEGTMRKKALPRTFEVRYSLGMLAKDMGIAASLAQATGFETDELFHLLVRAFSAARDGVGFEDDLTSSLKHWERRAGVELAAAEPHERPAELPRGAGRAQRLAVGVAGLGGIGGALAAHFLAAGEHRVVVYDADTSLAAAFAEGHGCERAGKPAGLAGADVLLVALPDVEDTRNLLLGPEGIADRLAPEAVIVDLGPGLPGAARRLAGELVRHGVVLVDAGVSVTEIGAVTAGRMVFMLGTDDARALDRVGPLLEPMSAHVFAVGPAGSGRAVSLLNDYVAAAGLRGALDGLVVGYRYGLDPAAMLEVLNLATGRVFASEQTLRLYALPRRYETGESLADLVGVLANAVAFGRELGLDTELLELVHRDFAAALRDLGDADVAELLRHWERKSGTELAAGAPPSQPAGARGRS